MKDLFKDQLTNIYIEKRFDTETVFSPSVHLFDVLLNP